MVEHDVQESYMVPGGTYSDSNLFVYVSGFSVHFYGALIWVPCLCTFLRWSVFWSRSASDDVLFHWRVVGCDGPDPCSSGLFSHCLGPAAILYGQQRRNTQPSFVPNLLYFYLRDLLLSRFKVGLCVGQDDHFRLVIFS